MKTAKNKRDGDWLVGLILEELALAEVAQLREQQQQQQAPAPPEAAPATPETDPAPAEPEGMGAPPGLEGMDAAGGGGMPDAAAGPGMDVGGGSSDLGGGMPGMDSGGGMGMDADPGLGPEDGEEGDNGGEQTIEDFIKDLSSKTVVDIKKTLLADLQTGDKRAQAEELMAQVEAGEGEEMEPTPENVKQAVEYIRRTFNFKVPPKAAAPETGLVE